VPPGPEDDRRVFYATGAKGASHQFSRVEDAQLTGHATDEAPDGEINAGSAAWNPTLLEITVAGIFMAVTGFEPAKNPSIVWANSWFDLGFAFVVLGALVVPVGVVMHFRREVQPGSAPIAVNAAPEPPPFRLRHYTREASLAGGWVTSHFVGVTNPAGQPERRAHMSAESMNPYPLNRSVFGVQPGFPHAVPPESAGTATAGLVVGPGQEQSWFIGNTWIRPDGKISVYEFFSDTGADWELRPDERWRVSYRIACDGDPDVPFSIVIAAEEGRP
jgi:hypothetical protein